MARPFALTLGEPAGIGLDIITFGLAPRAELDLAAFYLLAGGLHRTDRIVSHTSAREPIRPTKATKSARSGKIKPNGHG